MYYTLFRRKQKESNMRKMKQQVVIVLVMCTVISGTISAATNYVVTPGTPGVTPTANYTSWATAAANIQDAIDVVGSGGLVLVTNGTYVLTNQISISDSITVRSFNNGAVDRDGTVINGNYPTVTNRCVFLDHASAVLDGFTVTNGYGNVASESGHGGGIFLDQGTVTNCLITGNETPKSGGGVFMDARLSEGAATLTDCTISGNEATSSDPTNAPAYGGGVYFLNGGLATDCLIEGNLANNGGGAFFSGLYGGGTLRDSTVSRNKAFTYKSGNGGAGIGMWFRGYVRNCQVVSNTITQVSGSGYTAGVGMSYHAEVTDCYIAYNIGGNYGGGLNCGGGGSGGCMASNCVIMYNSANTGGGVMVGTKALLTDCTVVSNSHAAYIGGSEAEIRNCLFAENSAGLSQASGDVRIMNCTIVNNGNTGLALGHGALTWDPVAHVENSIITGHSSDNYKLLSSYPEITFTNSCTTPLPSEPYDTGNITNAPLFADESTGDYRLTSPSPCVNTGVARAWMTGAVDLDGNPRLVGTTVDMGAYELPPPAGTCIIVR